MKRVSRFMAFLMSLVFALVLGTSAVAIDDTTTFQDVTGYVTNMNVK